MTTQTSTAQATLRRALRPIRNQADALDRLAALRELRDELDRLDDRTAMSARFHQATWQQIADACGTTRQAAHQRWHALSTIQLGHSAGPTPHTLAD